MRRLARAVLLILAFICFVVAVVGVPSIGSGRQAQAWIATVQNPRGRASGHAPVFTRSAGEIRSDPFDVASLPGQIDATLAVRLHAPIVPSIGRRTV